MLIPALINAQTFAGEQDFSVNYGIYSGRQYLDNHSVVDGDGNIESGNSGNIFISYKYFLDTRFSIGIAAGFQTIKGGMYEFSGILEDNYTLINKTIAAEMTFIYLNKHRLQLYVLAGAGESFSSTLSNNYINYSYSSGYGNTNIRTCYRFQF